ncbi:hypothetical protein CCR97_18615 [Rhodoplanes elegans]|uniref:Uncharacterized protein n=1 Tax=Rhodoplanes elegans TaxID=29408 RepID=A0A327KJ30_9BRAD|nr:PQ-loop domain-containing transporter [Rhodoplanes elegans]MBK5960199.1 hypothetical protein [Rhodoplanes elegans]RAI38094.1 hypothetical protein CH338_13865 [Rhodoplanes elegans]
MASLLQQDFTTVVGLVAALCTTLSYIPQVRKCWRTGKAGDLSLRMLVILVRNPSEAGRVFRFQAGHRTEMKPAIIPI